MKKNREWFVMIDKHLPEKRVLLDHAPSKDWNDLIWVALPLIEKSHADAREAELLKKLNTQKERILEAIKYCEPHVDNMWAATVVAILLDCDFRDVKQKLAALGVES